MPRLSAQIGLVKTLHEAPQARDTVEINGHGGRVDRGHDSSLDAAAGVRLTGLSRTPPLGSRRFRRAR
jgi:hypothetical protein